MANRWYAVPVNVGVPNVEGAGPVKLQGPARSVTEWARFVVAHGVPGTEYEITCRHDKHGWLKCGLFRVPSE